MDKALKNSSPGEVAYIWRIDGFQIDAIKFERTQIPFFLWCFHCRRRCCLRSLMGDCEQSTLGKVEAFGTSILM